MSGLAPRTPGDSVRPRRQSGVVVRPQIDVVASSVPLFRASSRGLSPRFRNESGSGSWPTLTRAQQRQLAESAAQQQIGRTLHCLSPGVVCAVSLDKPVEEIHVQEIA